MSFEPTDRYDFGGAGLASELASEGAEPRMHRVRGTRAVFVRPADGRRIAVWAQDAIDAGWVDSGAVRAFAWFHPDSVIDQEERQIVDDRAASAARAAADLDRMIDGIYSDTVEAVADAPAALGRAVGGAAADFASAAPLTTAVAVAAALAVAIAILR